MKLQFKNKKINGFTLSEILLVVGLIAVASVVALLTVPKVMSSSRATEESGKINSLYTSLVNIFSSSESYENLGNNGHVLLINTKVAPEKMVSGNTLINTFGGEVTIQVDTLGANSNDTFRITTEEVPKAECVKIIANLSHNFVQIGVNGTTGSNLVKTFPTNGTIAPDTITSACDQSTNILYFWGK